MKKTAKALWLSTTLPFLKLLKPSKILTKQGNPTPHFLLHSHILNHAISLGVLIKLIKMSLSVSQSYLFKSAFKKRQASSKCYINLFDVNPCIHVLSLFYLSFNWIHIRLLLWILCVTEKTVVMMWTARKHREGNGGGGKSNNQVF